MYYKEFNKNRTSIFISVNVYGNGFDFEFLPRLCYRKERLPIYGNYGKCNTERIISLSWLIFYISFSVNFK